MLKDYYTSLANLQKTLARAYHIKNTSQDQTEVKKAIETIKKIEEAIIKLDGATNYVSTTK